jgi:4-amino-4-deoxy-L-arabinose transferase-like glycosyltransferase
MRNPIYPFLMDGKFLLGVLLSVFGIYGPAPLWVARCAIAIFSTLSCAACIGLGTQIARRPAGLLAGLLYALVPQTVFFERQAFADPLMAAFGLAALALMLPALRHRHWVRALPVLFFWRRPPSPNSPGLFFWPG